MTTTHTKVSSPIGELTVVGEDGALIGLYFEQHRGRKPQLGDRDDGVFAEVRRQLGEYFAGARTEFDLTLAPHGDEFERRVWALLRAIPYGETRSYGELARELGEPALAQRVGAANARNPLAVIVPCHRVVGADGSLTGYAGGLDRKRFLLELEEPAEAAAGRLF